MAQRLGIAQSFFTEVLKGRKNLSPETALRVAKELGLNPVETEYFCLLVQLETTRDEALKSTILQKIKILNPPRRVKHLDAETFKAISDWRHFAILNLTHLDDFDFTPANIARRLGITVEEASKAIETLLKLQMIEKDPTTGQYRKTYDHFVIEDFTKHLPALNTYHRQMLEKAIGSLEEDPQSRIISSLNISIGPGDIDKAKAILKEFFAKMADLSDRAVYRTAVYHLGVQFFSLTKE